MITRKELGYVFTSAKNTPYPGNDYAEETFEKLRAAYNLFNETYSGNKYNIIFSNNEELDLEICDSNLAHMLGISHRTLMNPIFEDIMVNVLGLNSSEHITSYDLLQAILENSSKVIDNDRKNYLKILNFYKVSIKSDIFNKLANLTSFNNGCINFNKTEYMNNTGHNFNPNSTKYFYIPSDEAICPYFFMGICPTNISSKDENSEGNDLIVRTSAPYFVETLFAPDQPQFFFQNQEVVIPTQILKINDNEMVKIYADASQKKKILLDYEHIRHLYGIRNGINIYADYIASLSEESKKLTKSP